MKYIRDLSKADDKIMSVSPQEHKENRPFVGIIVVLENVRFNLTEKMFCLTM